MKKISEILMVCVFAVFIAAAMAVTVTNKDEVYSYYENRLYAEMLEVSAENVIEGDFFNRLESFLCDHAAGRQALLKAKTYADVYLLRRPVVNEVVVKENVLLPFNAYERVDVEQIARQAEAMASQHAKLRDVVEGYGGSYFYAAVPCQYVCYEDDYPFYLNSRAEFTSAEISSLTEAMERYDLSVIDMLPVFESDADENPASEGGGAEGELIYSSKVDNHYGLQGAYLTYAELIRRINSETSYDLRYPQGEEIKFSQVEEPYLGSRQRKLMGIVPLEEHLYRAQFREEIPFTRTDNGAPVAAEVYSDAAFENGSVTYSLYMGGDIAETVIDTNRPELPSVLIYGDSFTNAVEVLAYYSFDEMRSVDLRHYDEMSLAQYVEKYRPDIVVCIRDYESLLATDGNGELF